MHLPVLPPARCPTKVFDAMIGDGWMMVHSLLAYKVFDGMHVRYIPLSHQARVNNRRLATKVFQS
uniref:Uncharacterized protein n=1 Tax=Arundo donax TaxID=35708 RepID=A0A0A9DYD4_ARUDO